MTGPTRERRPVGDRGGVSKDLQRAHPIYTGNRTGTVNVDQMLLEIIATSIDGYTGARELSDAAARLSHLVAELERLNLAGAFEPRLVAA